MKSFFLLLISLVIISCQSETSKSNINSCQNNPCAKSAIPHKTICKDLGGDYSCVCEKGYTETIEHNCSKNGNTNTVCGLDTCTQEHSYCREYAGQAICVCEDGYTLENGKCIGTNPCINSPCTETHKTICSRINNKDFTCYCDKGYAPNSNGNCIVASYGNYYSTITDDLKDNDLIEALYQKIKDHTVLTYHKAADKLNSLDGAVGVYSGLTGTLNTEHIWPQSYFNGQPPMVSDLHHLRNALSYVNSKRGNVHFGNVVKTDCIPDCYSTCSNNGNTCLEENNCCWFCDWDGTIYKNGQAVKKTQAKKGKSSNNCNSHSVFEPIDNFKGDVARSLFYFAVRYKNEKINLSQAYMTGPDTLNHIPPYEEIVLRKWHKEDPVSQAEINRNNKIYNDFQHNRNPFIDRPDLVDRISDF